MNPEENILSLPAPVLERAILLPLRPQSAEEAQDAAARVNALKEAAAADSHTVIAPTHLMVKGGKLLGYLSIAGLPNVHAWFDTQHPHAADSLKMIEMGELSLREKNISAYSLCCAEASPFTPHLERMGFTKLGTTVLYLKRL